MYVRVGGCIEGVADDTVQIVAGAHLDRIEAACMDHFCGN